MQIFRNLQQPEMNDIRFIPEYSKLSESQKKAAHELFNSLFEAYQGRGFVIATGMAYNSVKAHINSLAESTTDKVIASGTPEVQKAPVPQAHPIGDVFPNVTYHKDSKEDDLLKKVKDLFDDSEHESVEDHDNNYYGNEALDETLAYLELLGEKSKDPMSYDDVATKFNIKKDDTNPNTFKIDTGTVKINPLTNSWEHTPNGADKPNASGKDPADLHAALSGDHRKMACGGDLCSAPDKGPLRARTHDN